MEQSIFIKIPNTLENVLIVNRYHIYNLFPLYSKFKPLIRVVLTLVILFFLSPSLQGNVDSIMVVLVSSYWLWGHSFIVEYEYKKKCLELPLINKEIEITIKDETIENHAEENMQSVRNWNMITQIVCFKDMIIFYEGCLISLWFSKDVFKDTKEWEALINLGKEKVENFKKFDIALPKEPLSRQLKKSASLTFVVVFFIVILYKLHFSPLRGAKFRKLKIYTADYTSSHNARRHYSSSFSLVQAKQLYYDISLKNLSWNGKKSHKDQYLWKMKSVRSKRSLYYRLRGTSIIAKLYRVGGPLVNKSSAVFKIPHDLEYVNLVNKIGKDMPWYVGEYSLVIYLNRKCIAKKDFIVYKN